MQPGTAEEWVFYDHPSGWNRIHRAMVWKAEHIRDPDIAAYDSAHPAAATPRAARRLNATTPGRAAKRDPDARLPRG